MYLATTMRGIIFFNIIALCTLAEETSAVAATGRAGKSISRRSGGPRGARGRTGRPDAPPPQRRRDEAALDSDDGERVSWEEPSAVVIGTFRPEGGREVGGFSVGVLWYIVEGFHVSAAILGCRRQPTNGHKDHVYRRSASYPWCILCAGSRACCFRAASACSEPSTCIFPAVFDLMSRRKRATRVHQPTEKQRTGFCDAAHKYIVGDAL